MSALDTFLVAGSMAVMALWTGTTVVVCVQYSLDYLKRSPTERKRR